MDVKKANLEYSLMFLKQLKIDNLPLDNCVYDMRKECGNIIDLLEEGNKYKQIWEEFLKKWGAYQITLSENKTSIFPIYTYMKELEQKYLPSETISV